jgi:urease subunit alpha
MRPQWGSFGRAPQALSVNFVNRLAVEADTGAALGLHKLLLPAFGTRTLRKSDMLHNDACPHIRVDAQTFEVYADGELLTCEPVSEVPLAQRYMLR